MKIGGSIARNARFLHPRVSFRVSGFPVASPCLWGKLANLSFSNVSTHVVLSFCVADVAVSDIPTCVITCGKCRNWRKYRTKCSFFLHPRVSFRVSGCPVASPCLWGKLGNLTFSNVSKQVVLSFCVAGVAVSDIPTCVITCGKCQNWRKYRTKCSFFLHPRVSFRVSGCPVASPCLWGKLENLTFSNVSKQVVILFTLYTLHCSLHTPHFTLDTPLHSSLHTPYFTLYTFHFTLLTLHSALHTPHFPLHAPHSTLYTLGWWSRYSCGASCHVLLTWLREISALLSFKILINIQRCRCPKRWIELVSRVY